MAASSFDGVNIRIELDPSDASAPTFERQGYTTTRHVPSSNEDIIQVLGYGHGVLTARLLVDATEWTALQAKLLVTGPLIMAGVAQGNCLLEALTGPVRRVDGWTTVTAQFRKAAAS